MGDAGNAAQAARWNGDSGRRWIAQRERHAAVRHGLTPQLLRAAGIRPGDRVLDVGCGCGEITLAVGRLASPGEVVGLDLSRLMLDEAERLAAPPNVRFQLGDAQSYPLPPASFDVVISSFGVMFFDDPLAAFRNLRRALRPGGRLAFLCWQAELDNEVFALPVRAYQAYAELPAEATDDVFADPAQLAALVAGAGFGDVRVTAITEPARVGADVADVMAYLRETSRVRDLLARLDDELAAQVLSATAEEFAGRQRPDGVWVSAAAWLVSAGA